MLAEQIFYSPIIWKTFSALKRTEDEEEEEDQLKDN